MVLSKEYMKCPITANKELEDDCTTPFVTYSINFEELPDDIPNLAPNTAMKAMKYTIVKANVVATRYVLGFIPIFPIMSTEIPA